MPFVENRQNLKYGRWNQDMVESQPPDNPAPDLRPFRGTFVGRQRKMAELRDALDDAMAGQGRLVMLVGSTGRISSAGITIPSSWPPREFNGE